MILTPISLMSVFVSTIIGRILNLSRTYCVTRMSWSSSQINDWTQLHQSQRDRGRAVGICCEPLTSITLSLMNGIASEKRNAQLLFVCVRVSVSLWSHLAASSLVFVCVYCARGVSVCPRGFGCPPSSLAQNAPTLSLSDTHQSEGLVKAI